MLDHRMKKAIIAIALWAGLASAVLADSIEETLLANLRAEGYVIIEQGYTFLGRLRVVAVNGTVRREIVINPGTGEILRDYAVLLSRIADQGGAGKSSGSLSGGAAKPASSDPGATAGALTGGSSEPAEPDDAQDLASDDTSTGQLFLDGEPVLDVIVSDPAFQPGAEDQ
jgi:hypothetical protein